MTACMARHGDGDGPQPEARLPFMQAGMVIGPLGLVMYAWSAQEHVHWAVTLTGAAIFAIGMLMAYLCVQTYLVDAFEEYAASALAGVVIMRSIVGCVFSVIGFQLYKRLDYGW